MNLIVVSGYGASRELMIGSIKLTLDNARELKIQWPNGYCEKVKIKWTKEVLFPAKPLQGIEERGLLVHLRFVRYGECRCLFL